VIAIHQTPRAASAKAAAARVVIAEDSLLVREGLGRNLREAGLDVVGEAASTYLRA
jgi:AmiR/NasT family two-component response regulator